MINMITQMRHDGMGYRTIAKELNLNRDRVKYLCKKHGLDGTKGSIGKSVPLCICEQCGVEFKPKSNDRTKFCSRSCANKYNRLRVGKKINYCIDCGVIITNTSKRCMVCSGVNRRKPKIIRYAECKECGVIFKVGNRKKYCSKRCAKRHDNRIGEINRRHKLRENGPIDYSISLSKLVKRDGGVCKLCGGSVDMDRHYNHNQYGSIDHIIPVSKGGIHQWSNVQLAHRKCNSDKKDKI